MNWNVCIYVDGVGGCINVDGEIGNSKCELGVEKYYPSGRVRCNIQYKIDGRVIGRLSKSTSCLGKANWSPAACVEVHTRRRVEKIKRREEKNEIGI